MNRPVLFAILVCALSFAAWNESLAVTVLGANGIPLQSADVQVTYQKQNMVSDDGLLAGRTDENGIFSGTMQNFIEGPQEKRYYYVTASGYGWSSGAIRFEVSGTGSRSATINSTLRLREVIVSVSDQLGTPLSAIEIFQSSPVVSRQKTDAAGRARFTVPEGAKLTVFVTYGKETKSGTSTPGTMSASGIPFSFQSADNRLHITVLSPSGAPIPGAKVQVTDTGGQQTYAASGDGTLVLEHLSSAHASVTVPYQDAEFTQDVLLSPSTSLIFRVPVPMNFSEPSLAPTQGTCSQVLFQLASVPEGLVPSLEYQDSAGTARTEMEISGTTVSTEVCPYSGANATLWLYWTAGNISARQNYSFFIPVSDVPQPPGGQTGTGSGPVTKPATPAPSVLEIKIKLEQVLPFCGGVVALMVLSGAIVMREQILYAFKCAIRYVRKLIKF